MVVLNYLHVSIIFNSGVFVVLITKMQCPWGRDPAPWPVPSQVSFTILKGLFGLQKYYDLACF